MKSMVPDIKTDNAVRPDAGGVMAVFIPIFFFSILLLWRDHVVITILLV